MHGLPLEQLAPPPSVPNFGDRGVANANGVNQICTFSNAAGQDINNIGFRSDVVLDCGTAGSFDLGNAGPFTTYSNANLESTLDVVGTSLILDFDLGNTQLKSISAYRKTEYDVVRDADNTPLTILHSENHDKIEQISQEIQLTGVTLSGRLKWTAGAYYFKEEPTLTILFFCQR